MRKWIWIFTVVWCLSEYAMPVAGAVSQDGALRQSDTPFDMAGMSPDPGGTAAVFPGTVPGAGLKDLTSPVDTRDSTSLVESLARFIEGRSAKKEIASESAVSPGPFLQKDKRPVTGAAEKDGEARSGERPSAEGSNVSVSDAADRDDQAPASAGAHDMRPEGEVGGERIYLDARQATSRRADQQLRHTTENMTVVGAEEISTWPVHNASEALAYIRGVDVKVGSGFGHATDLSIQGSFSHQVLVMVDGIPFNQQASGQANPAKLPIGNIERIEIIKGGASSVWGSALGGVVNFITKDVGTTAVPSLSVSTSVAEHDTQRFWGEISGAVKDIGYYGFASFMQSDGISSYEDTSELKLFGKARVPVTDMASVTTSYGRSEAEIDENVSTLPFFFRAPYVSQYGQVRLDIDPDRRQHGEIAFKFNDQRIRRDQYLTVFGWDMPVSDGNTESDYFGSVFKYVRTFREADVLVAGYDLNWEILESTFAYKKRGILYHSPYINYTLRTVLADLCLGGREDWNSEYGSKFSPSFGTVIRIPGIPDTLVRGNISRAFHAPPLLWKYLEANVNGLFAVNPDIKPETAWVYELGIETQPVSWLWFKAGLYRANVRDGITGGLNNQGLSFRENVERFRRQGLEVETKIKVFRDLTVSGGASLNDVRNRLTGARVTDQGIPRRTFRLVLDYQHASGAGVTLLGRYDRSDYTMLSNDRKFIFDVRAVKRFKNILSNADVILFLNVYNLANYKYWALEYAQAPRRYFEGGVTLEY